MKINPYIKMLPPADFFGVKNQNYFLDFGVGNLISLGIAMQKKNELCRLWTIAH